VTTAIVYHATAKEMTIRSLESRLEGDIDLQGFLGIRKDMPRGHKEIQMFVNIDADAPLRAQEKNNSKSCLPVVPSPAFHPPAHIPICAGGCALATNPHSAPYCGNIYFHGP
jgi:hypothetical protein